MAGDGWDLASQQGLGASTSSIARSLNSVISR